MSRVPSIRMRIREVPWQPLPEEAKGEAMKTSKPKLSRHQKRIIASIAMIHDLMGHRWWSRMVIGEVVQAGGFHDVIQTRTMLKLREMGLVMLERQSWPPEVQALVRCTCGMFHWGLTEAGVELAKTIPVSWTNEIRDRIRSATLHDEWRCVGDGGKRGDLWEPPKFEDDDDDDFNEARDPSPVTPRSPVFA